jgi:hypothetical protein
MGGGADETDDYVRFIDEASGDYYYHCFDTETTIWDEPTKWREPTEIELLGEDEEVNGTEVDEHNQTSNKHKDGSTGSTANEGEKVEYEDWEECLDVTLGLHYYFNPQTNVTQWEMPIGDHQRIIKPTPPASSSTDNAVHQATQLVQPQHQQQQVIAQPRNAYAKAIAEGKSPMEAAAIAAAIATAIGNNKSTLQIGTSAAALFSTTTTGGGVRQNTGTIPARALSQDNDEALAAWALTANAQEASNVGGSSGGWNNNNGWQQSLDPDSKRPYYFNPQTNESQWEPPSDHIASILPKDVR